jgi:hypothetical protein
MSRILLLVEQRENRRLLADWLSSEHEVIVPDSPDQAIEPFDLGIVDGPALERNARWVDAVKRNVDPLYLPFLLLTHRQNRAWEWVDELIVSPVEKAELHARVTSLLRARTLSVANAALRRQLEAELARAHQVQTNLLPSEAPQLRGFDLAARCIPARVVGGDFFDWEAFDDTAVFSVGDVMGKGIPAALLAATARAVLRALARQSRPGLALDHLREALSDDLVRTNSFVTLFHGRLAVTRREVRYVDAGHAHAFVRRASGQIEKLERGGRPVGFPASDPYREGVVRLHAGDILCVYSDGLIGIDARPENWIASSEPRASTIVDTMIDRARTHGDVSDDVTVLILKSAY